MKNSMPPAFIKGAEAPMKPMGKDMGKKTSRKPKRSGSRKSCR